MGRGHLACLRPVPGGQDGGDLLLIERALPHGDQRPRERPDHLMQEGVGSETELEPVTSPVHRGALEVTRGGFAGTGVAAE